MLRYIIRRTLYMVPTVLGVILITFILFNLVGGSPAAVKLGKNASAKALQEFDEQRGLDKPPIAGRWYATRAYGSRDFSLNAGVWTRVEGAEYATASGHNRPGRIVLPAGTYEVPLEFAPRPNKMYRWVMKYRLTGGAEWGWDGDDSEIRPTGGKWKKAKCVFNTGADPGTASFTVTVAGGKLEISELELQSQNAHFFDSQLWFYLKQLARLDLGVSVETNQRVSTMLKEGVMPSLSLMVPMFLAGLVAAISLALVCAFYRNTFVDRFFVVLSVTLMSVNYLVWIVFGQYYFGYVLHWFPVWGYESWRYLVLPILIGVISGLGSNLRFYRTVMLDEMYKDYVRTAFAKGVSKRGVLFKHVLKNAMIPVLTNVVMALPFLFTGSLLLETFFGIPGLGRMAINAINSSDFDVVKALVLVGAMLYVVANLATDICYALVDPRVKLR